MNVGRNDPCPCGSGKKYKRCHGRAAETPSSAEDATWRRLRASLDGFPTVMLRFVGKVYGPGVVDEAWAEFTAWRDDGGFDPDTPHMPVFMPWFFHQWAPDPEDTGVGDTSLYDRSPTHVLLERRGRRLDAILRDYLEACLASPFSFHEIVRTDPGRGFHTRDVFTGEEHDVLERSASRTLQPGDTFFGQLATSHGITLLEACSPHALPPRDKLRLIDLRERMGGEGGHLTREALKEWDIEVRLEYLRRTEALRNPPAPQLQNTDGETIAFHRLSFDIASAQGAFDALKSLALDDTDDDLLESADIDADGRVRRVSFAWKRTGNALHRSWDNTVLGHIEIDGERLVVSVNSAERAARVRELVESRYPAARLTGTDAETVEAAMARRSEAGEDPSEKADTSSLSEIPEVRERIREIMAEQYADWIHEPIPALGGLTPVDAVKKEGGREKVEALVRQIERDGRRMDPPLDEAVPRRMRERLGLAE